MKKRNKIIEQLREDELRNINLLNFLENNYVLDIEAIGKSIFLRGRSDQIWIYISSSNEEELRSLKSRLHEKDKNFAAIEDWMLPVLREDNEIIWDLSMSQYYLPDNIVIPKSEFKSIPLSLADAETIYDNSEYKEALSIDYIHDRITNGSSIGLYEKDQLVAWGMTHDDGGMGFLHVLPECRRKKYGYNITLLLIEEIRQKGKIPFVYIEKENMKSINLVLNLNFKKHKGVHWFQLK
ncbi:MAG: GNAT family N-acetyltransferase [Deltaproteobacteria bacterium]|nr:GNAT family N-acetyltransferase [Candidatus Desulfobacula maris]